MSVSINIPDDLYEQAVIIAEAQKVPVDEIVASAFAEQLSIRRRLKERGALANRDKFLAVLDKAPDLERAEHDRI